jgi:hypothetical protein
MSLFKNIALLSGGMTLLVAASIAFAAPDGVPSTGSIATGIAGEPQIARAAPSRARIERSEPRGESTLVVATSDPSCARPRRKLWVEGEGWIVRRVAVCR